MRFKLFKRIVLIKLIAGLILTLFLASTLTITFNIQPVKADLKTSEAEYSSVYNALFTKNGTYPHKERTKEQVRIFENRITALELEKLKLKVGVWGEGRNYNQIINGHGTGLHPPTEEEWTEIVDEIYVVEKVLLSQITQSPSSVDHTTKPWFPPIGHQDGEGSCVAWAVGYYTKTFQEAKEHGWNLSGAEWVGGYYGYPTPAYQDRIFSPDFIYHLINGGIDNGSSFYDAINLVCALGASSWEKMPYDPSGSTSWPSEEAWGEAPLYRGNSSGFEYMELNTYDDLISLKNWITSDHLAVIAVDANQYSSLTSEDVWTLDNYVNPDTNHANTIVGYDDNIEYTEGGELRYGAFKIANSWGEGGWENIPDGCYWISYEAMKQRVGYCMFYRDIIGYKPELVSSFRIDHSKRGECDISVGMGSHGSPVATKSFSNLIDGGDYPFCSNNILFDITEFKDVVPTVYNRSFFIRVYDGGSVTTGTITDFSIKYAGRACISEDPPIVTVNGDYVFADVVLLGTIIIPDDYPTIQEAINAANPGDTIFVSSGTYYEHISISKNNLTLIGENKSTTIIDGNGTGTVVYVDADNIDIREFAIQNGYDGIHLYLSDGDTIGGNIIINNRHYGVYIRDCNGATLRDNKITGNYYNFGVSGWKPSYYIHDIDASNMINGKPIYYLKNQKNLVIDPSSIPNLGYLGLVNSNNITVKNLDLPENNVQGLLFVSTTNSTITNVNASGNVLGIHMFYSSHNTIKENSITNNEEGVLLTFDSRYNFIDDNTIINSSYGIEITGSAHFNTVNGNVVTNSKNAGIRVSVAMGNTILGNSLSNDFYGIYIGSSWNTLVENEIVDNEYGIYLYGYIDSNIIQDNVLINNTNGITLTFQAHLNTIRRNTIVNNINTGINLDSAPANTIMENSLINNGYGIRINGNGNTIRHNNFINNTIQADNLYNSINTWDDGYPSGGNHWSDYTGLDNYSGPGQNIMGSDGIGDTPYIIDEYNQDNYPLVSRYVWSPHNVAINSVSLSKTVVGVEYPVDIEVVVKNEGDYTETFNVSLQYDNSTIGMQTVLDLAPKALLTLTFTWNTTGVIKGTYTITAKASVVPNETVIIDNTYIDGSVKVTIPGDTNGDWEVNVLDLGMMGVSWLSETGEPKYKPNVDINGDGRIDVLDLGILGVHWLEEDC